MTNGLKAHDFSYIIFVLVISPLLLIGYVYLGALLVVVYPVKKSMTSTVVQVGNLHMESRVH